ncbi:MAG: excisionase family DNA-binding protein [Propionibacteriales bacterium]|nr:excisionase family DNA-binding protein [Propionibacteriales bacterium]
MAQRIEHGGLSYLTLGEAAEVLRVSERTVQRYVQDGRLQALRTPGGAPRFLVADLEAALAAAERAS